MENLEYKLAGKVASAIHSATDVFPLSFFENKNLRVFVSEKLTVSLSENESTILWEDPVAASALIERRPEAQAFLRALELRKRASLHLGAEVAEGVDSTLLHRAIDKLALALAPILADQLRTRQSSKPEPAQPPPKQEGPFTKLARAAGYVGLFLGAALVLALIRVGLMATTQGPIQTPGPAHQAAAVPAQENTASPADAEWRAALAAFIATRCELNAEGPFAQRWVVPNRAILQQAINDVDDPALSSAEVLRRAGERVYAYPGYTPRGYCPD